MKRDLITRRIAIAVLFAFSTLMLVAVAPLVYGLRSYDPTPGLALSASQADTLVINNPVRLSTNPDIVLVSGTVIAATTPQGAPPRGLTLVSPVIDVRIGSETPSASRLAAAMVSVLKPLVQRFGLRDHDNVSIQRGVVGISGKHSKSIALTDVVASIAVKHPGEFSASGQFIYAGQGVTFEISTSLRIANNAAAESATDAPSASDKKPVVPASAKTLSPMQFKMSSELFSASFDGGIKQEPPPAGRGVRYLGLHRAEDGALRKICRLAGLRLAGRRQCSGGADQRTGALDDRRTGLRPLTDTARQSCGGRCRFAPVTRRPAGDRRYRRLQRARCRALPGARTRPTVCSHFRRACSGAGTPSPECSKNSPPRSHS